MSDPSASISFMEACWRDLVLGIVQTNITRTRSHLVDSVFADFEPTILAIFFTLAGLHLTTEHLGTAGLLAVLYFLARAVGKYFAADLAMRSGATVVPAFEDPHIIAGQGTAALVTALVPSSSPRCPLFRLPPPAQL
mgnify:CR=1 FL=1